MADKPDLSIVIVNWNTSAELEACLRSIGDDSIRLEMIVIDNASADDSVEMVRREFPRVRLIENKANLGFAKGANQGVRSSTGRYVLLLNPDSEVKPGALSAMVRFGDENPEIGIFGPKILNPDGSLQYSCRGFPTIAAGFFRNTILTRFFRRNSYIYNYLMLGWDHSEPRDVDWVSGAALVARRELLEDIGMLDERFYMYCEDVDLAYRAHERNWRVTYFPLATVVHACSKASSKNPNRMIIEHQKSIFRYFRKHHGGRASTWLLVPIGLVIRGSFYIARNERNYLRYRLGRLFRKDEPRVQGQISGKGN
ncbi:MAG TPA: glycosyltransferase family 2 protein [Armatimonadota bacterium]|nr:glycosyltransferase family 2 protein [Armatimonadota bacterium]